MTEVSDALARVMTHRDKYERELLDARILLAWLAENGQVRDLLGQVPRAFANDPRRAGLTALAGVLTAPPADTRFSWYCQSCSATHHGHRPADGECPVAAGWRIAMAGPSPARQETLT